MKHLNDIRITLLVDNISLDEQLIPEHGFSCLVQADGHQVLFDTGAKSALASNSSALGISLQQLDALVFSHGHYDHTGGLVAVSNTLHAGRIVGHPNIFGEHRSRRTGNDRDIGMPVSSRDLLSRLGCELSSAPVEVVEGVWTTGQIPRTTGDRDASYLFVDSLGQRPDAVPDDMALVLRHRAGLVLVLGCAHAGVIDTIRAAATLFPDEPFLGIVGGMHLEGASPEAISQIVCELRDRQIEVVAPAHCTGELAKRRLSSEFGTKYHDAYVGRQFNVDASGCLR